VPATGGIGTPALTHRRLPRPAVGIGEVDPVAVVVELPGLLLVPCIHVLAALAFERLPALLNPPAEVITPGDL
jgi:hypothetical protein